MNTFKNNLRASLYYDMTDTDTVIWLNQLVSSTDATTRLNAWPTCDASHTFTLTLESTEDNKVREIIECTGVTANTTDYIAFSCTRAKENTVAIAHNKNTTNVENRVTAAALTAIVDALTTTMASVSTNTTSISTITSNVNALASTLIGSIQSIMASSTYVPNGCVPADGAEYTKTQFATLYTDYLESGKLLTCTYTEWATQVGLTGNCAKFALDTTNQKFKVPLLKDGDSITQASSAAAIGKSVKAGLPNIKGTTVNRNDAGINTGLITDSGSVSGAFKRNTTTNISSYGLSYQGMGSKQLDFDASGYNPIYSDSVTTVTDEQVRLRHFVVLASAQNSASVFDWSNYMAGLAGKLNIDMSNADATKFRVILQKAQFATGTYSSGTTYIPVDGTPPQITEGDQVMSLTFTPKSANSLLEIRVQTLLCGWTYNATAALFIVGQNDAIGVGYLNDPGGGMIHFDASYQCTDTTAKTFTVRIGNSNSGSTCTFNAVKGYTTATFGSIPKSSIKITEYAA